VIYLSVSPHVEPTHTFYDADGQRLPPRYGTWRAAGGGAPRAESSATLLDEYRTAAEALSDLARTHADNLSRASASGELKSTIDGLWETLRPVLQQVEAVERAWNDLALCAAE
jgi:hypothetical protein